MLSAKLRLTYGLGICEENGIQAVKSEGRRS